MLYAKNSKIDNLEIYISFLNSIIKFNTDAYKEIFIAIVDMAHQISTRKIDFSSVPPNIFDIVSILSLNHKEYFSKIDPLRLEKEHFEEIKGFLEKDIFEIL